MIRTRTNKQSTKMKLYRKVGKLRMPLIIDSFLIRDRYLEKQYVLRIGLCIAYTHFLYSRESSFDELTRLYGICGDVCIRVMFLCKVDHTFRTRFWISVSELFFVVSDMFFKSLALNQSVQRPLIFEPMAAYTKICDAIEKELSLAEQDNFLTTEAWIEVK